MTHQNLVLTEKAIKNHAKRLQKELRGLNQNISLGETQNLLAKTLGFNHFHELKKVLIDEQKSKHPFDEIISSFNNKIDENQYIKLFINPENKMNKETQKGLNKIISNIKEIDNKRKIAPNIQIDKADISEDYCLVFLKIINDYYEGSIRYVCHNLTWDISNYLLNQGHEKYYNIEYYCNIKKDSKIITHFENLLIFDKN